MSINIRAGLLSLVVVTALVGCGKKEEPAPAPARRPGGALNSAVTMTTMAIGLLITSALASE